MSSVLMRAATLAALLASVSAAQTKPGEVEAEVKLSALTPGLAGLIDEGDRFGRAVATVRDLDDDGHGDIVVGAPWDDDGGPERGAVWILFLNGDASIKQAAKISHTAGNFQGGLKDFEHFGNAVTYLGDVDQDGTGDIAVSAVGDDDGGVNTGAVWILFLLPDGTVERYQKISPLFGDFHLPLEAGDRFGRSLAGLPDIDGDGVFDLAVGASGDDDGGADQGCVYIIALTLLGKVKKASKISETIGGFGGNLQPDDRFGQAITSLGDGDGDGFPDLLVGADQNDDGGLDAGGAWLLRLEPGGTVASEVEIAESLGGFEGALSASDHFGSAVAPTGDLDGDAAVDAAVGALFDDDGGNAHGAVWILFFDEAGQVTSEQKISSLEGNFGGQLEAGDRFSVVGAIEDLDGDGTIELGVGAPGDRFLAGAMWILYLHASEWINLGHALPGALGPPQMLGQGSLAPASEVTLTVSKGKPLAQTLLVLGGSAIELPFLGGVLVPAPDVLVGPTKLDANGFGIIHGRWPPDAPPGTALWMQLWIPDPAGPEGFSATNALLAVSP